MRAEVGPVSRKRILVLGAVGFVLVFSWIAKRNEPFARPEAPVQAETSITENRLPPPAPAGATTGEAPTYTPPEASSLVGIWSVYNGGFVWLWPDGRAEARDGGCRLTSSPRRRGNAVSTSGVGIRRRVMRSLTCSAGPEKSDDAS